MTRRVCIEYSLSLEDGTEVDASHGEPWCFVLGDGSLAPGLEQAVAGLAEGESGSFLLGPGEAYGLRDEALIFPVPRKEFPADIDAEYGTVILFSVPSGEELPGTVIEIAGDHALVDFNHPLAGQTLLFQVHLLPPEV